MNDMLHNAMLGAAGVAVAKKQCTQIPSNQPLQEQVGFLTNKVDDLSVLVLNLLNNMKGTTKITEVTSATTALDTVPSLNKDGIEINTVLVGVFNNRPHILYVQRDGYQIGTSVFPTLSGAAQHLTGKRRSGWEFWKLLNGDTVGEAYKK